MTAPERIWIDAWGERIWIDAWGGNCSTVSGGTQRTEYIRADLAQTDPRDKVIARLVEELEGWLNIAHHCEITDGSCCCGDSMDNHSEPINCGHSPVDHGSYVSDGMVKTTVASLAAAKAVLK